MAETNGLLNRRTVNTVPRVRIPPSPPLFLDFIDIFPNQGIGSHNRSPIAHLLEAGHHRTNPLERRAPHLPSGREAMTVHREGIAFQDATPKAGNGGTHPTRQIAGAKPANPHLSCNGSFSIKGDLALSLLVKFKS